MEEYSTIRISSYKAHIFNHLTKKILCGIDRWSYTPFIINKTKYGAGLMLEKHEAFAKKRGDPNPYKYTCINCLNKINSVLEDIKMKESNFEKEIQVLVPKLENDKYAQAFYAALCNIEWKKLNTNYIYSCSWRYAGGLVANMRYKGESYLDFYCSGGEGVVEEYIERDLNVLGYIKI